MCPLSCRCLLGLWLMVRSTLVICSKGLWHVGRAMKVWITSLSIVTWLWKCVIKLMKSGVWVIPKDCVFLFKIRHDVFGKGYCRAFILWEGAVTMVIWVVWVEIVKLILGLGEQKREEDETKERKLYVLCIRLLYTLLFITV